MTEPDYFALLARAMTRSLVGLVARVAPAERVRRIVVGLEQVRPDLAPRFVTRLGARGAPQAIEIALASVLREHLLSECARILASFDAATADVGLGATPPDPGPAHEKDDIVQHNIKPFRRRHKNPKKQAKLTAEFQRDWGRWQEHVYRGMWWPAYQTPIVDLTQDDLALASAFLAGKLTSKGCPKSDWAQREEDRKNLGKRILNKIQAIAGVIASVVMGAMFGPAAGQLVNLAHRGKMALINRVWKDKVVRDPALKIAIEKLKPSERMSWRGFQFWLRPWGNMLMQELGCKTDLASRLMLHGRVYRAIDVLAGSSPSARSAAGLYDYPSAHGMLKGSIFPPRGVQFDGAPPTPVEKKQIDRIVATPAMQAFILQPSETIAASAAHMRFPGNDPRMLARSVEAVRAAMAKQQGVVAAQAKAQKPGTNIWPYVAVGGAALALAALLATRDSSRTEKESHVVRA